MAVVPPRAPPMIGVAGRCSNDEEKAYVKQAVFLLRYRMRIVPTDVAIPTPERTD